MRSLSTSCHQIARLSSLEKKTHTPYARPQKVVSTMRTVSCGTRFGTDTETASSFPRTHTCERFAAPASCFSVCLPLTYAFHNFSRSFSGRRYDSNTREQSRHRYRCTPRRLPFFLILTDVQYGHFR